MLNVTLTVFTGSLSSWFGSFPDLEVFSARSSELSIVFENDGQYVVTSAISACTKLRVLELGFVQSGIFPDSVGQLTMLERIDFATSTGQVVEWPTDWSALTSLKELIVKVQSPGPFPAWMFMLPALESLNINGRIGSTLPSAIGNLTSLKELRMQGTALNGTLPPQIGNLVNLVTLALLTQSLSGPLPEEMGQMVKLQYLLLRGNRFTSLPSTLGSMTSLKMMDLIDNQLTGTLPRNVQGLKSLYGVYLAQNNIFGDIDESYSELTGMQTFLIGNNKLTTLPDMSRWNQLLLLDVSFNPIANGFPKSLLNSKSLQSVSMFGCGMNGTIPDNLFTNMSALTTLYLYNNNISGLLPSSLLNLTNLQTLQLHENSFEGNISQLDFSKLPNLQAITLRHNKFTGSIPIWLFNMPAGANSIDISYNRLNGTIPDDFLMNLPRARRIQVNLSHNSLTGQLPTAMNGTNGAKFTNLDLSYNQLKVCANKNITVLDTFMSCNLASQTVPNYMDCGCEDRLGKCLTSPDPIGACIPCNTPAPSYESTGVDWMCYGGYWFYNGTTVAMTTFKNLTLGTTPILVQGNLTVTNITFTSLTGWLNVTQCLSVKRVTIVLNAADSAILTANGGAPPRPFLNFQYDKSYVGPTAPKQCLIVPIDVDVTQNLRACTLRSNSSQSDPRTLASSFSITSRKSCGGHHGLQWWAILLIVIACVVIIAVAIGMVFTFNSRLRGVVRPYHNRARVKMNDF